MKSGVAVHDSQSVCSSKKKKKKAALDFALPNFSKSVHLCLHFNFFFFIIFLFLYLFFHVYIYFSFIFDDYIYESDQITVILIIVKDLAAIPTVINT